MNDNMNDKDIYKNNLKNQNVILKFINLILIRNFNNINIKKLKKIRFKIWINLKF
jgi:hypothetical protein